MSQRVVARWLAVFLAFSTTQPVIWSGEAPVVDTSRTPTGTNVSSDLVNQLPTGRSFADLVNTAPQVAAT